MSLLSLESIEYDIGDTPILRNADLTVDEGERVCLIGRNGAGKTTLLRLISGELQPDAGVLRPRPGLRISQLDQALPVDTAITVREFVAEGLAYTRRQIDDYHTASTQTLDGPGLRRLATLERHIDALDGWSVDTRIDTILTAMDLPPSSRIGELSGGWQRRVGLARAMVSEPDLLLLDEPTNHLDLATIEWLENRIRGFPGSVVFVTHDRTFLERLATRIIEIDRARLTSWPGNYRNFLRRKEEQLQAEATEQSEFDKTLAQEEAWIRQGIQARRTRNEGRVRALHRLRAEQAERRRFEAPGTVRMTIQSAERESGRRVMELKGINHAFDDTPLISNLSLKIMRGDRIGLIGNNGVGKSTLLRIMLGSITPTEGEVITGTGLAIAHFDPVVNPLDPERTVAENVANGAEFVTVDGRDRHIVSYLKGFLFSPKRAMTPVRALSGGERNRVLLARMFARPSNVLVLDEPTNDLDVETLEVLEAQLIDYPGTLIVVSHDRAFLDNVVTSVVVFEAGGGIHSYVGGYSDWAKQGRQLAEKEQAPRDKTAADDRIQRPNRSPKPPSKPKGLSYALQRELDALPEQIEALEREIADLAEQVGNPGFYTQAHDSVQPVLDRLAAKQAELDKHMERWAELEDLRAAR